ncbi:PREDICTED: mucin-2-like [Thamnophis sirtalis]|uniref:Mucin-2-like n=1 Tax=Thamnophis sirtalis TaxID=35019 RepID=A0A6I9YA95_9SAUR|nr:PREDICTED: mucin-2-like [Thamnophis sirtalis]
MKKLLLLLWAVDALCLIYDDAEDTCTYLKLEYLRVQIGATQRSKPGPDAQNRIIKRLVDHKNYNQDKHWNNIALIELDKPVVCNDYVQPACLPEGSLDVDSLRHCYICGWGITKDKKWAEYSDILQETEVSLIAKDACNNSEQYSTLIREEHLCATSDDPTKVSCKGDGGGPLMCRESHTERYWLIGLNSWGKGCSDVKTPGVFTATQFFFSWIKEMLANPPVSGLTPPFKPTTPRTPSPPPPSRFTGVYYLDPIYKKVNGMLIGDLPHWRAVIGAWKLSSLGSEVHVRYIKRIVIHEDYQRSTETSDIALMELDQPVKCSDYIQPACLPDMTVTVSLLNHCYISGWGILGKAVHTTYQVLSPSSSPQAKVLPVSTVQAKATPLLHIEIISEPVSKSPPQSPSKAKVTSLLASIVQSAHQTSPQPSFSTSPKTETSSHTTSQTLPSSSSPYAKVLPESSAQPETTPVLQIEIVSELTSKTSTQLPTTLKTEVTSPLASNIQSTLQMSPQPSSPTSPKTETSSHTTSQTLSSSSSPHAKVLPESSAYPETTPVLQNEIVSELTSKTPTQPPSTLKTEDTSPLASITQSANQTSPQPSSPTSPKTETSSQATSQTLSLSSSPHDEVLHESTVQPETTPLLEIEIVSELASKTPTQPPSTLKPEGTSSFTHVIQSTLHTEPQHTTEPLPKPEIPTEVGSTSETESQPSPETNPELEAPHESITTSQPTSKAPSQPSPQTESEPELEATTQPVTTSQTTSEAPTHSETQSSPQTTSQPDSETTAQDVTVLQITLDAPTDSETQPSPQTTSEPESDTAADLVVVLQSTSEAPTHSETLHTEPKLQPEMPLLTTTLIPATSPPTSPSSPETTLQHETSRQPHHKVHPNHQNPEAPSPLTTKHKIVPIIEISQTDDIVLRFLRVIQRFLHIIRKLKDAVWVWPDLSNLKLVKESDVASPEEESESPLEDDLPGESW